MPYCRLFYHLVWPTRKREPIIRAGIENELFLYISKKARELDCRVIEINGMEDHIHVIIEIPPKISISEIVKKIKGSSSHEFENLYWATGYGAFTISERNLELARKYVKNQKEHHAENTIFKIYELVDEDSHSSIQTIREGESEYFVDEDYF